jgi:hypothetical protein
MEGLSSMIVSHLKKGNLFNNQKVVSEEFINPSLIQLESLRASGYDFLLIGKLVAYDVTRIETPEAEALSIIGFGLCATGVGVVLGLPMVIWANSMEGTNNAYVRIDFEVKETAGGTTAWRGSVTGRVIDPKAKGPWGVITKTADETAKESINHLIEKLKNADLDKKAGMDRSPLEKEKPTTPAKEMPHVDWPYKNEPAPP